MVKDKYLETIEERYLDPSKGKKKNSWDQQGPSDVSALLLHCNEAQATTKEDFQQEIQDHEQKSQGKENAATDVSTQIKTDHFQTQ